jgi:tetratricopeptide (TPR) repeat protein
MGTVTYPETTVRDAVEALTVPYQLDNTDETKAEILERYRHVWTPDLRLLDADGTELYRWNGYLPPAEFTAQLIAGVGQARLRRKEFDAAAERYEEVVRRFPTARAAPEALYFLAVSKYRASGNASDLLHNWHELEKTYPASEWTVKQNF